MKHPEQRQVRPRLSELYRHDYNPRCVEWIIGQINDIACETVITGSSSDWFRRSVVSYRYVHPCNTAGTAVLGTAAKLFRWFDIARQHIEDFPGLESKIELAEESIRNNVGEMIRNHQLLGTEDLYYHFTDPAMPKPSDAQASTTAKARQPNTISMFKAPPPEAKEEVPVGPPAKANQPKSAATIAPKRTTLSEGGKRPWSIASKFEDEVVPELERRQVIDRGVARSLGMDMEVYRQSYTQFQENAALELKGVENPNEIYDLPQTQGQRKFLQQLVKGVAGAQGLTTEASEAELKKTVFKAPPEASPYCKNKDNTVPFSGFLSTDKSILASWRRALRQQTWATMAIFQPEHLGTLSMDQFDEYYIKILARLEISHTVTNAMKATTYQVAISEMTIEMDAKAHATQTGSTPTNVWDACAYWGPRPNLPPSGDKLRSNSKVIVLADSGANIYLGGKKNKGVSLRTFLTQLREEWGRGGLSGDSASGATYPQWTKAMREFTVANYTSMVNGKFDESVHVIVIDNLNTIVDESSTPPTDIDDYWRDDPKTRQLPHTSIPYIPC